MNSARVVVHVSISGVPKVTRLIVAVGLCSLPPTAGPFPGRRGGADISTAPALSYLDGFEKSIHVNGSCHLIFAVDVHQQRVALCFVNELVVSKEVGPPREPLEVPGTVSKRAKVLADGSG